MAPDKPDPIGLSTSQFDLTPKSEDTLDSRIDRALSKYVFVWVWSVLFGTATGAAITFVNYRPFARYRAADLLMGVLMVLGGMFALMSIYYLYIFLVRILLPMFLHGAAGEPKREGFRLLSRAVMLLLGAFALGLFVVLIQSLLGGLAD